MSASRDSACSSVKTTWPEPFRRIITSHNPSPSPGTSVSQLVSLVPLSTFPQLPEGAGTPLFSSLACPTTSSPSISTAEITASMEAVPGVVLPNGVNCQVTDLKPGVKVGMHRTNSLDYNIITKGSVWHITPDEKVENGVERILINAGEVVVQRGTLHGWEAGPEGARWVCVVIAALPVEVDGVKLAEVSF